MSSEPILPATICSASSSNDNFVGDEKSSITYITYDEYRKNLDNMSLQDKQFMGFMRLFCDEQSNGATPEELLSESISKQRAHSDLYDA